MDHAQDWLLFEDNIGESLSIDETCLSSGEVYTFLTNKAGKGRKGTLVAVVKGTKAEDVIQILKKINLSKRKTVKEITLDLSSSMMRIAHSVFPKRLLPMIDFMCRNYIMMLWMTCVSLTDGWQEIRRMKR